MYTDNFDWGHWTSLAGDIPDDSIGFVYKITEKSTDKFYIGCKLLYKTIKRPPLKGKKRRRISHKDSDWRIYCSSSGAISENVEANKSNYKFEILSFHPSKTSMKIEEARLIIENIYSEQCYNQVVNLRVNVKK